MQSNSRLWKRPYFHRCCRTGGRKNAYGKPILSACRCQFCNSDTRIIAMDVETLHA
uniref:Uncharacterized protein n=1 Tax=Arundo donax TaxID=35708 RepID=A0A0A9QJP4_ARUDO